MSAVYSMYIYLITFILSILLIRIAEILSPADYTERAVVYRRGSIHVKNLISVMISFIAIMFPCFLAAVRDSSVGIDISIYITPYFNMVENSSISFIAFYKYAGLEFLFSLLIYFFARIGSIKLLFFVVQFLIIVPIYLLAYRNRKTCPISTEMCLFFFLFYNLSLCVMRQSIAMSFLLLSYDYLLKKEYKHAAFFILTACLFHKSAILIAALYFIIYFIGNLKIKKTIYTIVIFALTIIFFYYYEIIGILIKIVRLVSSKYAFYINRYLLIHAERDWGNIMSTDLLCKSLLIFIVTFFLVICRKMDDRNKNLFILTLLGRYFALFNANFYESMRIAYYFDFFLMIYVPAVYGCFKKNIYTKFLLNIVIFIPVLFYWLYFIIYIGAYGTNQFQFS